MLPDYALARQRAAFPVALRAGSPGARAEALTRVTLLTPTARTQGQCGYSPSERNRAPTSRASGSLP